MNDTSNMGCEPAGIADLPGIVEIYNWAIEHTSATFDTEVKSLESQQAWFEAHDAQHPIVVVKQSGRVVAWGSISRWSDRCAYNGTGEVSFYVHPDHQGKGLGTLILKDLIRTGREKGFRTLVSRITGNSAASIHLHKKLGFSDIGTMKKAGEKFGQVLDVLMMQVVY